MTAPAVVAGHAPANKARADRGVDRWGGLIEFYFRFHTVIVYIFLYLPIIVVVVFAFGGTDRVVTKWGGLSLKWFGAALQDEVAFDSLAQSSNKECNLKPVSFVKPIGEENEHPGYGSEHAGSTHLVDLLSMIQDSACAKNTMVIVTYDEFGGQWDHVSPPGQGNDNGPHDKFGPGTRIPALIFAPGLDGSFGVDSTEHDTTSILATIEHRFGLAPLSTRDAQVSDLSSVWSANVVDPN